MSHNHRAQRQTVLPSDIPVILPADDRLSLDGLIGRGLQPGEVELEDSDAPGRGSNGSGTRH